MKRKITVKMPDWFVKDSSACSNPSEECYGFTDGIVICVCGVGFCYYVEVPEFEYEGYFKISDLKKVNRRQGMTLIQGGLK